MCPTNNLISKFRGNSVQVTPQSIRVNDGFDKGGGREMSY